MEIINKILEKYFDGKTSLIEENQLKLYFKSGNVHPEHEKYKAIFEVFELESKIKLPEKQKPQLKIKTNQHKLTWIQGISLSGIAAAIILLFWLLRTTSTEDFAVINGKKIENEHYAQQLALTKIEKMNNLLACSMEPMQQIDKIKSSMEPIRKFKETRNEIIEIQNKNYIK